MSRVLVLGAGLVSKPLVHYLLAKGHEVVVASRTASKAAGVVGGHPRGEAHGLDVTDTTELRRRIAACDLAVSLVPFDLHPAVARLCIEHRKHMVTTSYVSPAMQDLDADARGAGVTLLNEIGVDPGIDHLSAMRVIDAVRGAGGRIVSFRSYCGGLPAPEAHDNPLGYKFSWAPRGVLLASRNGARYRRGGHTVEIAPERLFRDMHLVHVEGVGDFEAYPNRDSLDYIPIYGLEGIETMYRGTLRHIGWCDCLYQYRRLGLLDLEVSVAAGPTYADFLSGLLGAAPGDDLRRATAKRLGLPEDSHPVRTLEWLGMYSSRPLAAERACPLDRLGDLMREKLVYEEGERDMIVLVHQFEAEYPGGRRERLTSTMVDFGVPRGDSSMSRTVSLPAAIGVHRILTGKVQRTGVLRPVTPDLYHPILDELADLGIRCEESAPH